MERERTMEEKGKQVAIPQDQAVTVHLTSQAIEAVKHDIYLCQQLVKDVLEPDIDYGIIPGVREPFLWDPGASKIMAAFNSYAEHHILRESDPDSGIIAFSIEARLISRQTGAVVATGVGAASTREPKFKYRWVENPEDEGYERKKLKKKGDRYRIPNPEYGELGNTILKMAAKRAEVDAAQSLPGVASVLRRLFSGKQPPELQGQETPERQARPQNDPAQGKVRQAGLTDETTFTQFWGKVRQAGLTDEEVHSTLKVQSMKDWLAMGRTLKQALEILITGKEKPRSIIELRRTLIDILAEEKGLSVEKTAEWIQEESGKPGIELAADELESLIKKARTQ